MAETVMSDPKPGAPLDPEYVAYRISEGRKTQRVLDAAETLYTKDGDERTFTIATYCIGQLADVAEEQAKEIARLRAENARLGSGVQRDEVVLSRKDAAAAARAVQDALDEIGPDPEFANTRCDYQRAYAALATPAPAPSGENEDDKTLASLVGPSGLPDGDDWSIICLALEHMATSPNLTKAAAEHIVRVAAKVWPLARAVTVAAEPDVAKRSAKPSSPVPSQNEAPR